MKVNLDYEFYKEICLAMAEQIKAFNPDEIVSVMRGGMSASHIISKHLNIPCGAYNPGSDGMKLALARSSSKRVVFVEDLIAKGRTLNELTSYMFETHKDIEWAFSPVIIDDKATVLNPNRILCYGLKSSHWIVMPYEEKEKVVEGDWGLSRDGSDQYGKGSTNG